MSKQVLKYELTPGVDKNVELSADAKVVLVAEQRKGVVTIWIETGRPAQVMRRYAVIGTGHPVPFGAKHVGSAICEPFVWHVYELR